MKTNVQKQHSPWDTISEQKRVILVDFDRTLAYYNGWRSLTVFGPPIEEMRQRVLEELAAGSEVRIFTARADDVHHTAEDLTKVYEALGKWCQIHLGKRLRVTCRKTLDVTEIWDDLARQAVPNRGYVVPPVTWHGAEPEVKDENFQDYYLINPGEYIRD